MAQQSSSQPERKPRKAYVKPTIETVGLRIKEDVLAVCRTTSSATSGANCKITPCFT
ncbi:hypothetical protein [Herpetosiphon gulosus]|uniref:Uncharacterized protein n=1 Tax=Herpetosiphon gulosus TaxID=1973496 RepID=A0ABP9WWF9_9CHLR|nr:hypothetical protein [Chloroflexota bacterium]